MKDPCLLISTPDILDARLKANLNYLSALKIRLNIEHLKYGIGYTDELTFKKNISETVKKISNEISEIKLYSNIDNFEFSEKVINIYELEIECIIELLHMNKYQKK